MSTIKLLLFVGGILHFFPNNTASFVPSFPKPGRQDRFDVAPLILPPSLSLAVQGDLRSSIAILSSIPRPRFAVVVKNDGFVTAMKRGRRKDGLQVASPLLSASTSRCRKISH